MRAGFSHEEIYDVVSSAGVPGEQLQLLIDRIASDFHDAKIEPRPCQLATEVEAITNRQMEDLRNDILAKIDMLARQVEMVKLELEKLRYSRKGR